MYILIFSRGYPSKRYKMNGIFEFDQAKALANAGHKVIFAVVDLRSFRNIRKWGYESFRYQNVQVEALNIPCGRVPDSIMNFLRVYAIEKLYKRIIEKYGEPNIIHSHFLKFGYSSAIVFKEKGIPLILTEHLSAMNNTSLSSELIKMGKYTYPKMDKVIAVSETLSKNIEKNFSVEVTVVPNIIDTKIFEFKENRNDTSKFNFISVGSLIPRKGMDTLIEAFRRSFIGNKNVTLTIYGDGPEKKKLKNIINKYGLCNNVFLKGSANREEIANKMSMADCFVLASKLETFGVVYIEAMAMGLPVIATKCGGPENFVNDENGILISVEAVDSLVTALQRMYNSRNKYNRKAISEKIRRKFSPENVAHLLEGLYCETIQERNNK